MTPFLIFLILALAIALGVTLDQLAMRRRESFVRDTPLPPGLLDRMRARYPELSLKDRQLVARGLRKYFIACARARGQPVAMPSRVVGDLWQLFSEDRTRYKSWSRKATGRVLDVTAPVFLAGDHASNAALRRCWWHACREENLDPRRPTRLPLLFALDTKLRIAGGLYYFVDEQGRRAKFARAGDADPGAWTFERERSWTAADFRDTSFDGGTDGLGDSAGGDGGDGGGGGD